MFWGFGGVSLKQKTGIIPTDTLEDVPETHSNDDIHCKIKKNIQACYSVFSFQKLLTSCHAEVDIIELVYKKLRKVDIVAVVIIVIIILNNKAFLITTDHKEGWGIMLLEQLNKNLIFSLSFKDKTSKSYNQTPETKHMAIHCLQMNG